VRREGRRESVGVLFDPESDGETHASNYRVHVRLGFGNNGCDKNTLQQKRKHFRSS
jgi:hypothetical protein